MKEQKLNWVLEYGELITDEGFVNKCEEIKYYSKELQKVLDRIAPLQDEYEEMSLPEQIELDLFCAYTFNALQWCRLRIQGEDVSNHPIRDELLRIKAAMKTWQEIKDRDKRPTLDINAAKRFIKSGLSMSLKRKYPVT